MDSDHYRCDTHTKHNTTTAAASHTSQWRRHASTEHGTQWEGEGGGELPST